MIEISISLTERDVHTYEGKKIYIHFYENSPIKKYERNLSAFFNRDESYPIELTNNHVLNCKNDISPNDCFVFSFDNEEDAFYFKLKFSDKISNV